MKVLEINCSVRQNSSVSRRLAGGFTKELLKRHPHARRVQRDVGLYPPAHPNEAFTAANYTPPELRSETMAKALSESDELIDELASADRIVLGCPMYNFSVPSGFKAYVDNVVRTGKTFDFDHETFTFRGLLSGKKAVVISPSAANYSHDAPLANLDFCTPYVRAILEFIGITDIETVRVPDQFMPEELRLRIVEEARNRLSELAAVW